MLRRRPGTAARLLQVTAEQVDEFRRHGFLVLPQFTTLDDVARIRAVLERLYARFDTLPPRYAQDLGDTGGAGGPPRIPEINWTIRLAPELRLSATLARCREVASQLLGCRADHTGYDHVILKPPRNGAATAWHQDQAYIVDRAVLPTVHFWIPLHAVTADMGCMRFVPGSHLGPLLPHHRRGPGAHALEADVDEARAVDCPLPAGGATVHLSRTLHATGPNLTDEPRLAWSLEFGPRSAGWRPRLRIWFGSH